MRDEEDDIEEDDIEVEDTAAILVEAYTGATGIPGKLDTGPGVVSAVVDAPELNQENPLPDELSPRVVVGGNMLGAPVMGAAGSGAGVGPFTGAVYDKEAEVAAVPDFNNEPVGAGTGGATGTPGDASEGVMEPGTVGRVNKEPTALAAPEYQVEAPDMLLSPEPLTSTAVTDEEEFVDGI